uniref:ubiquitinyl hydrolase 1 n=1 Tax=Setaria digitata TaxID=48799 RepID=A0A915Q7X2_9BILA
MFEGLQHSSETVQEPSPAVVGLLDCDDATLRKDIECPHKNKKGLFKAANLRKKVKNLKKKVGINYCEDCARLDPPELRPSVWICVTCSYFGCDERNHTLNHFKALRTGSEHPLFFALEGKRFRCQKGIDVAEEEESGSVKAFLCDYNSFIKPKLKISHSQPMKSNTDENSLHVEETNSKKSGYRIEKCLTESKMKNNGRKLLLPVKGLANLGNTCFFNSIAQCLLHTHILGVYINLVGKEDNFEIVQNNVLVGDKQVQVPHVYLSLDSFDGPLNNIFATFIRDFKAGLAVNPSSLFSEIARKAPRFRGWAQQDAHELLRYLMDGLRTEEINRYKESISRYIKTAKIANPKLTEGELALLAKINFYSFHFMKTLKYCKNGMLKACGRPLIDAVFGGTLLQTVKCSDCGHLSKTYEDFLDLSLPLPSTSAKTLFNGTHKMHKSASLSLSKYQKKKEKTNARKGNLRRKSHEIISRNDEINPTVERSNLNDVSDEDFMDDDDIDAKILNGNICKEMNKMNMNTELEDCLQLLDDSETVGDEPRSLASCLRAFTATEILSAPDTYECEKCCVPYNKQLRNGMKKRTVEAEKRYLIYEPPPVLTLHLKRFEQTHSMSGRVITRKVPGQISFPKILNIAPFCTQIAKRIEKGWKKVHYSLYGVVSHSGDLSSGHYVAFVKSRYPSPEREKFFYEAANLSPPDSLSACSAAEIKEIVEGPCDGEWYYASDMRVNSVSESRVLSAEGYILFYERIF